MKIYCNDIGTSRGEFFVLCKKSVGPFYKGEYYKISGFFGDPQGSIEAGEEYMSSNFLNAIKIEHNKGVYFFLWKGIKKYMFEPTNLGYFQDFFIYSLKQERKLKMANFQ